MNKLAGALAPSGKAVPLRARGRRVRPAYSDM